MNGVDQARPACVHCIEQGPRAGTFGQFCQVVLL